MSGKFSGNMAATEGQAWADLERGFSGDLHTLLPPGLLFWGPGHTASPRTAGQLL